MKYQLLVLSLLLFGCPSSVQWQEDAPQVPVADADVWASSQAFPELPTQAPQLQEPPQPPQPLGLNARFSNITDFFLAGDAKRVVLVTEPSWCGPCRQYENNVLPTFSIKVGEGFEDTLQVVRTDEHTHLREIFKGYVPGYPCHLSLRAGQVYFSTGAKTEEQVKALYDRQ